MAKILLVEDDPLLVDIYSTKLKEGGFEVEVVDHGEKVLEAVEKQNPDLLLLDVVLPHMDGWDILSQIRSKEEFKAMPIIIISNLSQKEEIEKGLRLGATKYLVKAHYTPGQVVQEVENLIKNT